MKSLSEIKLLVNIGRVGLMSKLRDKEKEKYHRLQNLQNIINMLKCDKESEESQRILQWILSHDQIAFPYPFTEKYKNKKIDISFTDDGFPFTMWHGRRLYLKKSMSREQAENYMRSIYLEQDAESPHRYEYTNAEIYGKCIADFGAAEGFFSLDVVDKAKMVYIFECDKEWVEALRLTFWDYRNKVSIVEKYISDKEDEKQDVTSIDEYFKDKKIDFLKADIEGFEIKMLIGGRMTLSKVSNIMVCVYHRQNAEKKAREILEPYGFSMHTSDKKMLFLEDLNQSYPYFRHGLLYAQKNNIN